MQQLGLTLPMLPIKAYSVHVRGAARADAMRYATHLEAETACLVTPYAGGHFEFVVRRGLLMTAGTCSIGTPMRRRGRSA
jgi:hypothetical protein